MSISPRMLLAVAGSVLLHVLGIRLVWWSPVPAMDPADGALRPSTVIYLQEAPPISAPASVVAAARPPARAPKPAEKRSDTAAKTRPAAATETAAAMATGPQPPQAREVPTGPAPAAQTARGSGLNLTLPGNGYRDPERKSYAERANEQLQVRPKDVLAEGIRNAVVPDCLHDDQGGGLLGLPIAVYRAAKGQCK